MMLAVESRGERYLGVLTGLDIKGSDLRGSGVGVSDKAREVIDTSRIKVSSGEEIKMRGVVPRVEFQGPLTARTRWARFSTTRR